MQIKMLVEVMYSNRRSGITPPNNLVAFIWIRWKDGLSRDDFLHFANRGLKKTKQKSVIPIYNVVHDECNARPSCEFHRYLILFISPLLLHVCCRKAGHYKCVYRRAYHLVHSYFYRNGNKHKQRYKRKFLSIHNTNTCLHNFIARRYTTL